MQTLTNDIKKYYMQLLTTKCLNTAVLLAVFMLGSKRGIAIADHCDTEATRKRHQDGLETNMGILATYQKDILSRRCKQRYLYYILLTDGKFPFPSSPSNPPREPAFFPGHVFILEKIPCEKPVQPQYYNFYQSYINQYDLKGHVEHNKNTLAISHEKAKHIIDSLNTILNKDVWDDQCIELWRTFTFADSSYLKGSIPKGNVFICIKKAKVKDCLKHIQSYTDKKLRELSKDLSARQHQDRVYGNASLYGDKQNPLTIKQMHAKLMELRQDILSKRQLF